MTKQAIKIRIPIKGNAIYTSVLLIVFFLGLSFSFLLVSVGVVGGIDQRDVVESNFSVLGATKQIEEPFLYPSLRIPKDLPSYSGMEIVDSWVVDEGGFFAISLLASSKASPGEVFNIYKEGFETNNWDFGVVLQNDDNYKISFEKLLVDFAVCQVETDCFVSGYVDISKRADTLVKLTLGIKNEK